MMHGQTKIKWDFLLNTTHTIRIQGVPRFSNHSLGTEYLSHRMLAFNDSPRGQRSGTR